MTHYPLTDPASTDSTLGFYNRTQCIEMNLAFAHAMLAARERGQESFTIGPKVDDTPLVGAYIERQLQYSPMSSGAAACLNMTLDTSRPAALPVVALGPHGNRHRNR
jgi:hypothetical protein